MLLYCPFWTCRCNSCPPASSTPIHARLDSFITRIPEKCLLSAPPPSPSAPAGSSGSHNLQLQQLRITSAACLRTVRSAGRKPSSNPALGQQRHPSETWSAPGNARQEETCCIPPWACALCICWLSQVYHTFLTWRPILSLIYHSYNTPWLYTILTPWLYAIETDRATARAV